MKFIKNLFSSSSAKKKKAFKSKCYITLDVDEHNNFWIDWGWVGGHDSMLSFCGMIAQLNQGMLLNDMLETIESKCIADARPDEYKILLETLNGMFDTINHQERGQIEEMKKQLSSPLIKPTQVMKND